MGRSDGWGVMQSCTVQRENGDFRFQISDLRFQI